MSSSATITFCSVEYADAFLNEHHWIANWQTSDNGTKQSVLVNATNVIQRFVKFYNEDEEEIEYIPTSDADPDIPDWLKQACCYEALYFLDLENDPARPFPLGILGLIKSGSDTFDHNYEPPLFSVMAAGILRDNGAIVNDPNDGVSIGWAIKKTI